MKLRDHLDGLPAKVSENLHKLQEKMTLRPKRKARIKQGATTKSGKGLDLEPVKGTRMAKGQSEFPDRPGHGEYRDDFEPFGRNESKPERNSETNNFNFVTNNYIINSNSSEDFSLYSSIKPVLPIGTGPKMGGYGGQKEMQGRLSEAGQGRRVDQLMRSKQPISRQEDPQSNPGSQKSNQHAHNHPEYQTNPNALQGMEFMRKPIPTMLNQGTQPRKSIKEEIQLIEDQIRAEELDEAEEEKREMVRRDMERKRERKIKKMIEMNKKVIQNFAMHPVSYESRNFMDNGKRNSKTEPRSGKTSRKMEPKSSKRKRKKRKRRRESNGEFQYVEDLHFDLNPDESLGDLVNSPRQVNMQKKFSKMFKKSVKGTLGVKNRKSKTRLHAKTPRDKKRKFEMENYLIEKQASDSENEALTDDSRELGPHPKFSKGTNDEMPGPGPGQKNSINAQNKKQFRNNKKRKLGDKMRNKQTGKSKKFTSKLPMENLKSQNKIQTSMARMMEDDNIYAQAELGQGMAPKLESGGKHLRQHFGLKNNLRGGKKLGSNELYNKIKVRDRVKGKLARQSPHVGQEALYHVNRKQQQHNVSGSANSSPRHSPPKNLVNRPNFERRISGPGKLGIKCMMVKRKSALLHNLKKIKKLKRANRSEKAMVLKAEFRDNNPKRPTKKHSLRVLSQFGERSDKKRTRISHMIPKAKGGRVDQNIYLSEKTKKQRLKRLHNKQTKADFRDRWDSRGAEVRQSGSLHASDSTRELSDTNDYVGPNNKEPYASSNRDIRARKQAQNFRAQKRAKKLQSSRAIPKHHLQGKKDHFFKANPKHRWARKGSGDFDRGVVEIEYQPNKTEGGFYQRKPQVTNLNHSDGKNKRPMVQSHLVLQKSTNRNSNNRLEHPSTFETKKSSSQMLEDFSNKNRDRIWSEEVEYTKKNKKLFFQAQNGLKQTFGTQTDNIMKSERPQQKSKEAELEGGNSKRPERSVSKRKLFELKINERGRFDLQQGVDKGDRRRPSIITFYETEKGKGPTSKAVISKKKRKPPVKSKKSNKPSKSSSKQQSKQQSHQSHAKKFNVETPRTPRNVDPSDWGLKSKKRRVKNTRNVDVIYPTASPNESNEMTTLRSKLTDLRMESKIRAKSKQHRKREVRRDKEKAKLEKGATIAQSNYLKVEKESFEQDEQTFQKLVSGEVGELRKNKKMKKKEKTFMRSFQGKAGNKFGALVIDQTTPAIGEKRLAAGHRVYEIHNLETGNFEIVDKAGVGKQNKKSKKKSKLGKLKDVERQQMNVRNSYREEIQLEDSDKDFLEHERVYGFEEPTAERKGGRKRRNKQRALKQELRNGQHQKTKQKKVMKYHSERGHTSFPYGSPEKNDPFCLYSGQNQNRFRSHKTDKLKKSKMRRSKRRKKRPVRDPDLIADFQVEDAQILKQNKFGLEKKKEVESGQFERMKQSELVVRTRAWTEQGKQSKRLKVEESPRMGHSKSGRDMRGGVENNLYQMMEKRENRKSQKGRGKIVGDLLDDSSDSYNDSSTSSNPKKTKGPQQETHSIYAKGNRLNYPPSPRLNRQLAPAMSHSQLKPGPIRHTASRKLLVKKASLQSLYQKQPRAVSSQRGIIKNMKALGPVNTSQPNTQFLNQDKPVGKVNQSLNFNIKARQRNQSNPKKIREISKPPPKNSDMLPNQRSVDRRMKHKHSAAQLRARALRASNSRPVLRSKTSSSKPPDPNLNSSNKSQKKKRVDRATVFHYEFNANTFKNFFKTLCEMGFNEFDIDSYQKSKPRLGYKDSPFPTKPMNKALAKQSSMLDLSSMDGNKSRNKVLGLAHLMKPPSNDSNIYKALFNANQSKKPNTRSLMLGDKKYNNRHNLFSNDSDLMTRPASKTKPDLAPLQPLETSIILDETNHSFVQKSSSVRNINPNKQGKPKINMKPAAHLQNIFKDNDVGTQKGIPGQHALKRPKAIYEKTKLSRQMSSNLLPTKLAVIPEQSAEEERRSVARELQKVGLMDRAVHKTGRKWFAKLQRFDIFKAQDAKCKRYLILDLDETLLHCSVKQINKHAHEISLQGRRIYIHLRPYVRAFLREMRRHFNLVLYTASQKAYADKVLDFLDPQAHLFCLRLYRTSCQKITNNYVLKTLQILPQIDLSQTLVIDNSLICFFFDFDNLIPIVSYFGNSNDTALLDLTNFIKGQLLGSQVKDFRPVLKDKFGLDLLKTGFDSGSIAKAVLECQPI